MASEFQAVSDESAAVRNLIIVQLDKRPGDNPVGVGKGTQHGVGKQRTAVPQHRPHAVNAFDHAVQ